MMDEKNRFRLLAAIAASTVVGAALFAAGTVNAGDLDNWAVIATAMVAVAIALAALLVVRKRFREMKSGFPSEDEMSTAVKMRAGYLSFFASMYLCLGLGWVFGVFLEDETIEMFRVGEIMFILVAVMGVTYMVAWAVVSRGKGMP